MPSSSSGFAPAASAASGAEGSALPAPGDAPAAARGPHSTPAARRELRRRVAAWAREHADMARGQPSALVTPPPGCSLTTAFGILADGAHLLGSIAEARAELPEIVETERWFDLSAAPKPMRIERRVADDPSQIPAGGDRRSR